MQDQLHEVTMFQTISESVGQVKKIFYQLITAFPKTIIKKYKTQEINIIAN